jgi:hypothetical protein
MNEFWADWDLESMEEYIELSEDAHIDRLFEEYCDGFGEGQCL